MEPYQTLYIITDDDMYMSADIRNDAVFNRPIANQLLCFMVFELAENRIEKCKPASNQLLTDFKSLAKMCGRSVSEIKNAMKYLTDNGYVNVEYNGNSLMVTINVLKNR